MAGDTGRPNSGDSSEGIGREMVWGGGGAHPRPICQFEWGGGAAGGAGSGAGLWPPLEQLLRRAGAAAAVCWRTEGSRVDAERGWWARKTEEWGVGTSSATASHGQWRRPCRQGGGAFPCEERWRPLK
jgi:hypothetical protein